MGLVQDLELVTRAEAQVLCSSGLVVKQGHKVVAMASLRLLTWLPGSIGRAGGPRVLNHFWLVCLLEPAGETWLQILPEPPANVAHAGLLERRGEGLLPLPFVWTDPLSLPPPGNLEISTKSQVLESV